MKLPYRITSRVLGLALLACLPVWGEEPSLGLLRLEFDRSVARGESLAVLRQGRELIAFLEKSPDFHTATEVALKCLYAADSGASPAEAVAAADTCIRLVRLWRGDEMRAWDWITLSQAAGIASKHLTEQGLITKALQREEEANSALATAIRMETGREWRPGQPAPAGISAETRDNLFRNARYDAFLLCLRGGCVEALAQLQRVCDEARQAAQHRSFYAKQLLSELAAEQKFLGYRRASTVTLKRSLELSKPGTREYETARLNLAYWRSEVEGPDPLFLREVRDAAQKITALGEVNPAGAKTLRRLLAKMAYAYRETGFDIGELQALVSEAEAAGEQMQAVYARRDLALIQREEGDFGQAEANLLSVLGQHRATGRKQGEPSVYRAYGQLLLRSGRPAEAVDMLGEALRQTRSFGWVQHLPMLLMFMAQAQGEVGDLDGLRATLQELEKLSASGVLEPDRNLDCGVAISLCHRLLGRASEAETALRQAVAQARTAEVPAWEIGWAEQFFQKTILPATPSKPAPVSPSLADLQPRLIDSVVIAGEPALARFTLSNPFVSAQSGTLVLQGEHLAATWEDAAAKAKLSLLTTDGQGEMRHELSLDGGEEFLLQGQSSPGLGGKVTVRWEPRLGPAQTAVWNIIRAESDGADVAVTNASLANRNAFYALRLHHAFSRRGGNQADPVDFRVVASQPVRLETWTADANRLLSVDARGDGNLDDVGDMLVSDANRDGAADLICPAGAPVELALLVYPLAGAVPVSADLIIDIQLRGPGGWETVAKDILKGPSGK